MPIEYGAFGAAAMFLAGLIYYAGQLAQRINYLERWREEHLSDTRLMRSDLNNIGMLLGLETQDRLRNGLRKHDDDCGGGGIAGRMKQEQEQEQENDAS